MRTYKVQTVRFESPFDFVGSLRRSLENSRDRLPQKSGEPYNDKAITDGTGVIQDLLKTNDLDVGLPVNITVVTAYIENCQRQQEPKTLDVVYRLITSRVPFFFSRVPESVEKESSDPAAGTGVSGKNRVRFLPFASFNDAAKVAGGGRLELQELGAIKRMVASGEGGSRRQTAEGAMEGSWAPGKQWLQQLDWRASYIYADVPSEAGQLKKSAGVAQLSALLRGFGARSPMLRAGVAFEGGGQGSLLDPSSLPAGVEARTGYTSFKTYAGLAARGYGQTFGLSYGLQLGTTGLGFGNGFRKHIGDISYDARFLPRDHMPHEIEVRLTGGWIQNLGGIPVGERFFGGNIPAAFVPGDVWKIRASPVVRSFAQNDLGRTNPGMAAGADQFVAANFTYAPTVWGKPIVPRELLDNQEFPEKLSGTLNTAQQTLQKTYEAKDPAVQAVATMTAQHKELSTSLKNVLSVLNEAEDKEKGDLEDAYLDCVDETDAAVNMDVPKMSAPKVTDSGVAVIAVLREKGTLDRVSGCVQQLRSLLGDIDTPLKGLEDAARPLREAFKGFHNEQAAKRAKTDMEFPRRVIHRILHEMNAVSIAPVFLFDAARLGPQGTGGPGFRYGIGGGLRFSIASAARFTVAYAVNPDPRPWERRGAFFVSFDVVDLFY